METRDRIYKFIISYKRSHDGNSPSLQEIADGCEVVTKSMVAYHLNVLEIEGKIKRLGSWREARSIQVVGGRWEMA